MLKKSWTKKSEVRSQKWELKSESCLLILHTDFYFSFLISRLWFLISDFWFLTFYLRLDQNRFKARQTDESGACAFWFINEFFWRVMNGDFRLFSGLAVKRGDLRGFEQSFRRNFLPVRISHDDVRTRIIGGVEPQIKRFCHAKR